MNEKSQQTHSVFESTELYSTVPLIYWPLHGSILHVLIVTQFVSFFAMSSKVTFWVVSAGFVFYGLMLLQFTVFSPRMVRFDTRRQILNVFWRGEWKDFLLRDAVIRTGIRTEDTCGWFARRSKCLLICVSSQRIDRGLAGFFRIQREYRFAVGDSDSEVGKWAVFLGQVRGLSDIQGVSR